MGPIIFKMAVDGYNPGANHLPRAGSGGGDSLGPIICKVAVAGDSPDAYHLWQWMEIVLEPSIYQVLVNAYSSGPIIYKSQWMEIFLEPIIYQVVMDWYNPETYHLLSGSGWG
ncbi:hypothetical protein RRG08_057639 [Elysia crispata]|uniref:Uncharacterized protein n=1 Tax=Elysia crispata TaxID=231223 RepID=A0AAE1A0Z6_9GAST|nr:hypothetical protein RRG08_057639 [Elysia crispata]